MTLKDKLWSLNIGAQKRTMDNFNKYSLLVNASEVSKNHYRNKPRHLQINPMGNIPAEYRVAMETTQLFDQPKLVSMYDKELKDLVTEDYFIKTISIVDGLLEDVYEMLLLEKGVTEKKAGDLAIFGNGDDKLPHALLKEIPKLATLKNGDGYVLEDFLHMYEIYRQARHAIIHNKGELKERHKKKLIAVCALISAKIGKPYNYEDLPLFENNKVKMDLMGMVQLRKWTMSFLAFITLGIEED